MKRTSEKTYDQEYTLLLKGFKVALKPSANEGYYQVTLKENGVEVFNEEVPNASQDPGESEEQVLNDVAQAAVDKFESERGTLGQGAGAKKSSRKKSMKKHSYLAIFDFQSREDWYMQFKGTQYENTAYELLNRWIDTEFANYQNDELTRLYEEKRAAEYELAKMDLERMKNMPMATKVIIINAAKVTKKACLDSVEEIKDYLAKFSGDSLESKAVRAMKSFVDLKEKISSLENSMEDTYKACIEIEHQMEALSMEALSVEIDKKVPTEGIEAFPNMAGDIADLMQGVSLEEPLIPMSGMLASKKADRDLNQAAYKLTVDLSNWIESELNKLGAPERMDEVFDQITPLIKSLTTVSASKTSVKKLSLNLNDIDTQGLDFVIKNFAESIKGNNNFDKAMHIVADINVALVSSLAKIAEESPEFEMTAKKKKAFQEAEPVADRINEMGQYHNGQPAESDIPDNKNFAKGDKVSTTKEFTFNNGMPVSIPKGTSGVIEGLFDGAAECYVVRLMPDKEESIVTKVPSDILKKSK